METGGYGDDPSSPSSSAAGSPRLCWQAGREGQWLGRGAGGERKNAIFKHAGREHYR